MTEERAENDVDEKPNDDSNLEEVVKEKSYPCNQERNPAKGVFKTCSQ